MSADPPATDRPEGPTTVVQRVAQALRLERSVTGREMVCASAGLIFVGLVALMPHLRHGGFYLDDWANAATALQPPGPPDFGNALSAYADLTIYRPVLVLYVPLSYFVLGTHMHYHLALAALLAVLAAAMFYGVLRMLGVPWVHALLIAALAIVFPWSDSTRLWVSADQVTLSIFLMFAGMLLALVGLRRGRWQWHVGAAFLYLLSILSYEVTLPVVACAGSLYYVRAGWRRARVRWLVDLAVALVGGAWVGAHTARTASGGKEDVEHLGQIVSAGGTLLGRAGIALGSGETVPVLAVIAIGLVVGVCVCLFSSDMPRPRPVWGLRSWLGLTVGGIVLAGLGWAMFVPADPYYTPTIFGEANRVNGLAAFGLILAVYGTIGTFGSVVGRLARRNAIRVATGVTVALGVALFGTYLHVLRRHIEIWDRAFSAEAHAIEETKERLPVLPPGSMLFVSDYPANQSPNVPILAATWDFDGMVKLAYDDSSLSASPVLPGLELQCRNSGIALEQEGTAVITGRYGVVRLLNLSTGTKAAPAGRHDCQRVIKSYTAGPLFLSPGY